ncbi:hypothetical protein LXL04_015109 [Taraxacum kok-saghyz]
MSDEIPFHLQEQIIKRLPVISLLQFRSVSKAWKSVIDNSNFIAAHSAHSVTQPQHLFLKFVHILPQSVKLLKRSSIIGSLGLLCFHGYTGEQDLETEMVVLWNPTIRKSIDVDVPNNPNPDCETEHGFGVCPVTADPKIIAITQFHNTKTNYHCEAIVYALSSGKWRSVSNNLPSKPFRVFWPHVVVERFIYWCAFDPMTMASGLPNHNQIMSFDTTDENFGVIDLPDSLRCRSPTLLCISKLRESLILLEYTDFFMGSCAVWMMENGVHKSFTKLFTVKAPYGSRTIRTLGFRKSGQPIMELESHDYIYEKSELVVYHPDSQRFICLAIYGTTESFVVNSYMETLVLLGY